MKNAIIITIAAMLVACGGAATSSTTTPSTPGQKTYSNDKFGLTYIPDLDPNQLSTVEAIDEVLRSVLGLTPEQFTTYRGNVTVIQDSVSACTTMNCLPTMDICWGDGCQQQAGPVLSGTHGTGSVISTTIHVQTLTGDPCVFDIEYGMNLGFWLEQQKLGVPFSFGGNCPDCQAMNNALRASSAVCRRAN